MGERSQAIPFVFVGNHPCLDFINTQLVLNGQAVDLFALFSDLIDWTVQMKLVSQAEAKDIEGQSGIKAKEILEQVRDFRATLRDMVERIAAGKPVPQSALEAINDSLRSRVGYAQLTGRGRKFERSYQAETSSSNCLLGLLAEAAADLLTRCDLSLIKKCQNPACVLFFFDTTKNHTRHWCSMSLCGNRSKVAAHYRRHWKARK